MTAAILWNDLNSAPWLGRRSKVRKWGLPWACYNTAQRQRMEMSLWTEYGHGVACTCPCICPTSSITQLLLPSLASHGSVLAAR